MPLFFFISGCFIKPIIYGDEKKLILKKIRTILLPQITLALLTIVITVVFDVILKHNMTLTEVNFFKPFGSWFLIVLFLMELFAIPLITLIHNKKILLIIILVIFAAYYVIDYAKIMYVQQTLVALIIGLIGYLTKPMLDKYNINNYKLKGLGWITLLVVAMFSMCNDPVAMYLNEYGSKPLFLLTALLGIYSIFDISVSLRNTSFLQWCGRESIIIYVLQFSIIKIVISACTMFIPLFKYSLYPYYIISFIIAVLIIIPCTLICSNYLRFAFGRF